MIKSRSWTVTEPWRDTVAGEAFSSFEKVFALSGEPVSKDKESLVFCLEIENQRYYIKQYHKTSGIRSWFGLSRIRQEARNQLWFSQIGLPAAQVVAFGEEHILSRTIRGALITESLDNTRDLAWTAKNRPNLFSNRTWVGQVITQVAEITRTLHQHKFCHNDLKWRNILVSQDIDHPQVFLIDCPVGQRLFGPFLKRRFIKDLACLDKVGKRTLSRTQRLRFYKEYRQSVSLAEEDREIIQTVLVYFKGRD
jgi:tRNA A-37 threonylcarbamoyl transferase component Bud32